MNFVLSFLQFSHDSRAFSLEDEGLEEQTTPVSLVRPEVFAMPGLALTNVQKDVVCTQGKLFSFVEEKHRRED